MRTSGLFVFTLLHAQIKGLWISFFCIVAGWISIGIGYSVAVQPTINGIMFFGGIIMFFAGVIGAIVYANK